MTLYINIFAPESLLLEKKMNEPFLLLNVSSLTHDSFSKKIKQNFLVKVFTQ